MDEDIPVDSFQSICRTCFVSDSLISIENVTVEGASLESMILSCANINVKSNPCFPQKMCKDCIYKVCTVNTFLSLCRKSEDLLNTSWNKFQIFNNNLDSESQFETIIIINNDFDDNDNGIDIGMKEETGNEQGTVLEDDSLSVKNEQIEFSQEKKLNVNTSFTCDYCNINFDNLVELRRHRKLSSHRSPKYSCTFCVKKFVSGYKLREHIRSHTFENQLQCDICKKKFSHKATYDRHLLCHSEEKSCICSECGAAFKRPETLRCHERKLHGRAKLLCTFCGKSFNNESGYSHHRNLHFTKVVKVDPHNSKQCKICGKVFSSETVLSEHLNKRHSVVINPKKQTVPNKKCPYCKIEFNNQDEIWSHRLDSTCADLYPKYKCFRVDCKEIFFSRAALMKHSLNKHAGSNEELPEDINRELMALFSKKETKYFCNICGGGFFKKFLLKRHVLKHTGVKFFNCVVCKKSLSSKHSLDAHLLTHTEKISTLVKNEHPDHVIQEVIALSEENLNLS